MLVVLFLRRSVSASRCSPSGCGRAILSQNGERQEFQSFYVTKKDIQSVTSKYYEFKNFNNEVEAKISTDEGAFLWG